MNNSNMNALLWCNKTTRSRMQVIDSYKGTMEARKMGKWQPICVRGMSHGLDNWPRRNTLMQH